MSSVKILFIIADANKRGGTEILAFNLLHGLIKEGVPCKLLSITPYYGDDSLVVSFTKNEYQLWKHKNCAPLNKLLGCRRSDSMLRDMIVHKAQELKTKWIVNHTYDIVAAIPTNRDFHTAQVFNWSIKGYENSVGQIINKKNIINQLLSKVGFYFTKQRWHHSLSYFDKLVLLTNAAHAEIMEVSSVVQNKQLIVIPNPLFVSKDSRHISTLQNKNLTFVGRLSFEKGIMRLLRIWEYIYKQLPEYTLSIYGEGDAKTVMEDYISKHYLPRILFKGFCKDLEEIYTQSDLLLMTSNTEGFGMVLIEAMYFGVPCISFDCPISPKEIISDSGLTIPCFDEKAYANKIVELLENKQLMNQFQIAALRRAQFYYIDKIIQKWLLMIEGK